MPTVATSETKKSLRETRPGYFVAGNRVDSLTADRSISHKSAGFVNDRVVRLAHFLMIANPAISAIRRSICASTACVACLS